MTRLDRIPAHHAWFIVDADGKALSGPWPARAIAHHLSGHHHRVHQAVTIGEARRLADQVQLRILWKVFHLVAGHWRLATSEQTHIGAVHAARQLRARGQPVRIEKG